MNKQELEQEFRRKFRKLDRKTQQAFLEDMYETVRQNEAEKHRNQYLMHKVKKGDLETVEKLLSEGIDINAADRELGNTALFYAIINNDEKMVELLMNNGANPYIKNIKGFNPHDAAKYLGNQEIISLLKKI